MSSQGNVATRESANMPAVGAGPTDEFGLSELVTEPSASSNPHVRLVSDNTNQPKDSSPTESEEAKRPNAKSKEFDRTNEDVVKEAPLPRKDNSNDGNEREELPIDKEFCKTVINIEFDFGDGGETLRKSLRTTKGKKARLREISDKCNETMNRCAIQGMSWALEQEQREFVDDEPAKLALVYPKQLSDEISDEAKRRGVPDAKLERHLLDVFLEEANAGVEPEGIGEAPSMRQTAKTREIVLPLPPEELSVEEARAILGENWRSYEAYEGIIDYLKANHGMGPLTSQGLLTRPLLRKLSQPAYQALSNWLSLRKDRCLEDHGISVPKRSTVDPSSITPEVLSFCHSVVGAMYRSNVAQKASDEHAPADP